MNWSDYLNAFGSVATPILVILLTGIGWKIRKTIDRRIELENKLREDRIEIYNIILEPFFILFMPQVTWEHSSNKDRGKYKNLAM